MKNGLIAIASILIAGVLAFCCGFTTAVLSQVVAVLITVGVLFCILTQVFVSNWGKLKDVKWYTWVADAIALAGCIVSLLATRFASPLWFWIGLIIIIADVLVFGAVGVSLKRKETTETK